MARMIPDEPGDKASGQERRLFQRLRRELPAECVVLHSLGLPRHPYKLWGESDFVVLSSWGIFVLEEKGGGISCRNGVWTYTRGDGRTNTSTEGPFNQAKSALFTIKEEIRKYRPDLGKLLMGFGVLTPDEDLDTTGPEIEPGVLLSRKNYRTRMDVFITSLSEYWTEKYRQSREGWISEQPRKADILAIQQLLRPDIVSVYTLNSTLCQAEQDQVNLTDDQMKVLNGMLVSPRSIVQGAAGTGKTLLAVEAARRCAESGKGPVLFLSFNILFADHVNQLVASRFKDLPFKVWHIHAWFRELIKNAGMLDALAARPADDEEYYHEYFPEIACNAIVEKPPEPVGCLVMDEAQDLLRPAFMDAVDLVLKGGLGRGNWHVFFDQQQALFSGLDPAELQRLREYRPVEHSLWINCRNTERVAVETSIISSVDAALDGAVEGGFAEVEFVGSDESACDRLEKRIEKLRRDGVPRNEIIILSGDRLEKSCLAKVEKIAGLWIQELGGGGKRRSDTIDFCTMHAFKGLERRVVLAIGIHDLDADYRKLLHYCGLSRARTGVVAFIPEKEKTAFNQFAADFGRRRSNAAPSRAAITTL